MIRTVLSRAGTTLGCILALLPVSLAFAQAPTIQGVFNIYDQSTWLSPGTASGLPIREQHLAQRRLVVNGQIHRLRYRGSVLSYVNLVVAISKGWGDRHVKLVEAYEAARQSGV